MTHEFDQALRIGTGAAKLFQQRREVRPSRLRRGGKRRLDLCESLGDLAGDIGLLGRHAFVQLLQP